MKQILQKDGDKLNKVVENENKEAGKQTDTTKKNEINMGLEEMFTCQICYL